MIPDRPWREGEELTAEQLYDWIRAFGDEHKEAVVAHLKGVLDQARGGWICRIAGHEAYPHQVQALHERLIQQFKAEEALRASVATLVPMVDRPAIEVVARYRNAWRSARRRARRADVRAFDRAMRALTRAIHQPVVGAIAVPPDGPDDAAT